MSSPFSSKTFGFLKDLAENNDRAWFKENQQTFEADVREPALDFIDEFGERLRSISPHFIADPSKVGGSLFRIQRDIRFSKDKTPYKTHTGMQFRHVATKDDVHAPGFYLHIEPGACYAGVGLWRPSTNRARTIRQAIHDDTAGWKKAAHSKAFAAEYELTGDSLVRVPKEFEPDHEFADDLRRKDFVASTSMTQKRVTSANFIDDYEDLCRAAAPFMQFLCDAVGVKF